MFQPPETSGAGCREVLVETQELRGKKQQRVFENIIFFHIAEDENTSLGGEVSFEISCTEMQSFDGDWACIT